MRKKNGTSSDRDTKSGQYSVTSFFRDEIARIVLVGSLIIILAFAGIAVWKGADTMSLFNILLPVLASWVGTVLAFYFGRQNFESANQQVRQLVSRIMPEQVSEQPVSSIMRGKDNLTAFKIDKTHTIQGTKLSDLLTIFEDKKISRLPIIDCDEKPQYMIHQSAIQAYINKYSKDDSLETFLENERNKKIEYGLDKGFVLVSEQTTIADAKEKMEKTPPCQDILVTKGGTPNELLTGWISNVRLAKSLEA